MEDYEIDRVFMEMTQSIEAAREKEIRDTFQPESRPIPEGLMPKGIPMGHIAFMGDFDKPSSTPPGPNQAE